MVVKGTVVTTGREVAAVVGPGLGERGSKPPISGLIGEAWAETSAGEIERVIKTVVSARSTRDDFLTCMALVMARADYVVRVDIREKEGMFDLKSNVNIKIEVSTRLFFLFSWSEYRNGSWCS